MKIFMPFALSLISLGIYSSSGYADNSGVDIEVSAGAEYDTNLNVIELDKNSNENDVAAVLNAKIDGQWQATDKLNLSGGYAFSGKKYQDNNAYNLVIHQLSADAGYDIGLLTAGATYHFAKAELKGKSFLDLTQGSLYVSKLMNNRFYLRAATNWQEKTFQGFADRNATNAGLSGDAFLFFNEGKTFITAGISTEKENARVAQYDYKGMNFKSRVSHKFPLLGKEHKVQLGYRHLKRDYSGVTPEIKAERYDKGYTLDASWELSLTKNLAVETKIEHGKYDSNFAAADYSENRVAVLLKARF